MQPWSEVAQAVRRAIDAGDFERAHALIDPYEELATTTGHTELAGKVAFYRGVCFDAEGRYDDAIDAFQEAIDPDVDAHGEESRAVADATSSLALVYTNAGRAAEAADAYLRSEELYRAVGDHDQADSCVVQACQRMVEAGDFQGVLDMKGVITTESTPAHCVSWLVLESEARRRLPESDPERRTENMLDAYGTAAHATRFTSPPSPELREALRRAWINYAFLELCFRDARAGGLAYSMALLFCRNAQEREWIAQRAASFAEYGENVVLTTLDPEAFVLAKKVGRGLTVLHRDHGQRFLEGETTAEVGEPIDVVVRGGVYQLA